jgi:hypothetical protein
MNALSHEQSVINHQRNFKVIKRYPSHESIRFRITIGFAACSLLLFGIAHPHISYISLLAVSALFKTQPLARINAWSKRLGSPLKLLASAGIVATLSSLLLPSSALAAWDGAQTAAQTAFGEFIGTASGLDVIKLLFTAVFLILFFMIVGGLMSWGYRSFRNEEAAASMTAFIVGAVIFVGGEVFSRLFFGAGGTSGATAAPGAGGI